MGVGRCHPELQTWKCRGSKSSKLYKKVTTSIPTSGIQIRYTNMEIGGWKLEIGGWMLEIRITWKRDGRRKYYEDSLDIA